MLFAVQCKSLLMYTEAWWHSRSQERNDNAEPISDRTMMEEEIELESCYYDDTGAL
jgi:hypothetical protein